VVRFASTAAALQAGVASSMTMDAKRVKGAASRLLRRQGCQV